MADEPKKEKPAGKVKVKWTAKGADMGAWSEFGTHKKDEIVETEFAELLIERGFAVKA